MWDEWTHESLCFLNHCEKKQIYGAQYRSKSLHSFIVCFYMTASAWNWQCRSIKTKFITKTIWLITPNNRQFRCILLLLSLSLSQPRIEKFDGMVGNDKQCHIVTMWKFAINMVWKWRRSKCLFNAYRLRFFVFVFYSIAIVIIAIFRNFDIWQNT